MWLHNITQKIKSLSVLASIRYSLLEVELLFTQINEILPMC